ncbi:NADH-ubiquinone oxidoreductase chain 5 [Armadillidium vulgare]|nr:NADH-ubiquinone oxidoreductase chain 5 [Armadillidium vulgare]
MMLGWDGLGIISYILVAFVISEKSRSAGILTVIRNRVGDAALLLSIAYFVKLRRGKIIHRVGDYQDREGEIFNLPITSGIMVLSSYALYGVPFIAEFYSKDLNIEVQVSTSGAIT